MEKMRIEIAEPNVSRYNYQLMKSATKRKGRKLFYRMNQKEREFLKTGSRKLDVKYLFSVKLYIITRKLTLRKRCFALIGKERFRTWIQTSERNLQLLRETKKDNYKINDAPIRTKLIHIRSSTF